jgi:hypothetical protein
MASDETTREHWTWRDLPWLVEQHIDLPGLTGQWLRDRRFPTQAEAEEYVEMQMRTASHHETYRVRLADGSLTNPLNPLNPLTNHTDTDPASDVIVTEQDGLTIYTGRGVGERWID